ncbi:hypothetical protein Tco_0842877 [Tanacetum coccineum]|uniref:Uncharacterized protein n=1 Tax=Tanacetum coccineum TaxID=301880 RepID=A0ABQ5B0H8_9ASTR
MLPKFSQIVNRLYAFIYETNHSKSGLGLPSIVALVMTQFDLKPHMQSQRWTDINAGIQQHLQKLYNTNKASLKETHWIGMPRLPFGMIPGTKPGPLKIAKTGQIARSYASRDLGHLLAFEIRCSATREYPSLIHAFFVTHIVGGVFTRDEDRAIYEEMLRLQGLGSNTPSGVPYTEEEINALARKRKQRGHLPGVGRVLSGWAIDVLSPPRLNARTTLPIGSGGCGDDEMADDKDDGEDEELEMLYMG